MVSKRHVKMLVVIYGDVASNITPFSDWSECRQWRIQMPTVNFSPSVHAFATGKLKSNWMTDMSKLSDVVANDMNIAKWNWFLEFSIQFSGRTEKQAVRDAISQGRTPPAFKRTPSRRQPRRCIDEIIDNKSNAQKRMATKQEIKSVSIPQPVQV